jgi:SAM-dependent MidA family methyltransferase
MIILICRVGEQDITAHVDFTALQRQGEKLGLKNLGFTQQGLFLMALGLGDRLNQLSQGKIDILTIFQRRDALHQLNQSHRFRRIWSVNSGERSRGKNTSGIK